MIQHALALRTALALLIALAPACSFGVDSVFFVTNTSVGADFESQPPAAVFGYDRQEVVVGPAGTDGSSLPVLATMGLDSGWFDLTADQSFATGAAALVMAAAHNSEEHYFGTGASGHGSSRSDEAEHGFRAALDPAAAFEPTEPDGARSSAGDGTRAGATPQRLPVGAIPVDADPADRRCILFGTNTGFGLQAKWLGEGTPVVPSSLHLGFKRKELAMVPLVNREADDGTTFVELASLLATVGVKSRNTSAEGSSQRITQTFATGHAATLLAADPDVRAHLGRALLGAWEARHFSDHFDRQTEELERIEALLDDLDDADDARVRQRAVDLELIPDDGDVPDDLVDALDGEPEHTEVFERLRLFAETLRDQR